KRESAREGAWSSPYPLPLPPPAGEGREGGQRPDHIADRLPPPNPPPHAGEGVMRGVEGLARFLRRVRPLPPLAGGGLEGANAQIASLAGCPPPNPPPPAGEGACCPAYPSPPDEPSPASGGGRRPCISPRPRTVP